MEIGQTIKVLRTQRHVTQEALAKELFVTPQAVSRWENGTALPDITLLPPIAHFFGVTVDQLLSWGQEEMDTAVQTIQLEYYHLMDKNPQAAEQLLREGLRQYPGNEKLLGELLYVLRKEERREERISLCRRLMEQGGEAVRFRAVCVLAKTCAAQGYQELAQELLEELPEMERTKLEVQALLLGGETGLQAAQREKSASLARLVDMLQVIAAHQNRAGQRNQAAVTIEIAQNVIEAFRPDQPYQFPLGDGPTQTYAAFEKERQRLAELQKQYGAQ